MRPVNGRSRSYDPVISVWLKVQITSLICGGLVGQREVHVWSSFKSCNSFQFSAFWLDGKAPKAKTNRSVNYQEVWGLPVLNLCSQWQQKKATQDLLWVQELWDSVPVLLCLTPWAWTLYFALLSLDLLKFHSRKNSVGLLVSKGHYRIQNKLMAVKHMGSL